MKYHHLQPSRNTRKHKSNGQIQKDLCSKDFFECVNRNWLHSVSIPPYLSSFGVSEELEKQIETQLFQIAYECQKKFRKQRNVSSVETMVGAVVDSALKTQNQQTNVDFLRKLLQTLQCVRTKEDIASSMGDMCKHKVMNLLDLDGHYFDQHEKKYTLAIRRGKIGLPDELYYKDSSPGRWKTLHYYKKFLGKIGKAFELPSLDLIVELEKQLAPYILMKNIHEKEKAVRGNQLESSFPHIPWEPFFEAYGLPDWKQRVFAMESREWLSIVNKLFQHETVDTWRLLLQSQMVLHFVAYLPPPYDDYHYEFFRKRLRGQAQKLPQKFLMLSVLTEWFTPFLSKLYVEKFAEKSLKADAFVFATEIQKAACHRLQNVEWLSEKTRDKAIQKVEKMRLSIAYPDSFGSLSLSLPEVNDTTLIQNVLSIGAWHSNQEREKLGISRQQEKGWQDPVYAVNAYYYSEANELILPMGSLLDPFYSKSKALGWNYGGLGAILAHEITHAFDEEGKDYNPSGIREPWWTPTDKEKFTKLSKEIIELYSSQKILGHSVDGESTLSENIADLGGLAIALDALQLQLAKQNASEETKKAAYRQFFISYAVSWRVKERPEKQLQALLVDRHAPTRLRVNLVVNQFDEFYDAFEIQEGDPMYIAPKKRLRIF